ncbi:12731_t:CDS:2, partial [Racocetra persica]
IGPRRSWPELEPVTSDPDQCAPPREAKYGVISQFSVTDSPKGPLNLDQFSSERSFEHFEVSYLKFGLKRYNITVELTASKKQ